MNKKKTITIGIVGCLIIGLGAYMYGALTCFNKISILYKSEQQELIGRFTTCHYVSKDKRLKVTLSNYIKDNEESFYQLNISDRQEVYFGNVVVNDNGCEEYGMFMSSESKTPIKFVGKTDKYYIIEGKDTTYLTFIETN